MSCNLLAQWLVHYDPIHRGGTMNGIAHGMLATNGFAFPRIRGGYNLRRRVGGTPCGTDVIVGAAGAWANSIDTFPWVRHEAETTYTYRLTAIGGGGVENLADTIVAEVAFDEEGAWPGPRPNAPTDLSVAAAAGGRFDLVWRYVRDDEQTEPSQFAIYHDDGTGTVEFDREVASVSCRRDRHRYSYRSEAFDEGARVIWAVRAVGANGVNDGNTRSVSGLAHREPPPANPQVVISCVPA